MAHETDPQATTKGPGGTPEGHTPEAAAPDEYGRAGTPAAGLAPATPHPADAAGEHESDGHASDEHAAGEHAAEPLGPIDWPMWAAGAGGVLLAVLVALALALPTMGG